MVTSKPVLVLLVSRTGRTDQVEVACITANDNDELLSLAGTTVVALLELLGSHQPWKP